MQDANARGRFARLAWTNWAGALGTGWRAMRPPRVPDRHCWINPMAASCHTTQFSRKVPDSQAINEPVCGCHRKFLLSADFLRGSGSCPDNSSVSSFKRMNSPLKFSGATARFLIGFRQFRLLAKNARTATHVLAGRAKSAVARSWPGSNAWLLLPLTL